MALNILSPVSIWADFVVPKKISFSLISSETNGGFLVNKYFIDGRVTENGQVKIFLTTVSKQNQTAMPAVIVLKEFEHNDIDKVLFSLAERNYLACTVDIEGRADGKEYYTQYPECVEYANYIVAKDCMYKIEDSVKKSCWFEWTAVLRFAIGFVDGLSGVDRIGAIGYGVSATCLWQAVMDNKLISSLVIIRNSGWASYKGNHKFDEVTDIQSSDEELVYIAGVEPQSYAQFVKCPTFILANPNDSVFDADRAHDTLKRIDTDKKGLLYDSGSIDGLNNDSVKTIEVFLEDTLLGDRRSLRLYEPLISSRLVDGVCQVTIEPLDKRVVSVRLFASEEELDPAYRCYVEVTNVTDNGKKYVFSYAPFYKSKRVTFFATVKFENGGSISSNIDMLEFNEQDVVECCKYPIIYSGRNIGQETIFLSKNPVFYEELFSEGKTLLQIEGGAQAIKGLSVKNGLITFAVKNSRYKPNKDNFLMFDLYTKCDSEFIVRAYTGYYENRKEYSYSISLSGLNAWQNIKIELSKLKTEEGKSLKEIDDIQALEFYSKEDVLINNLLWV